MELLHLYSHLGRNKHIFNKYMKDYSSVVDCCYDNCVDMIYLAMAYSCKQDINCNFNNLLYLNMSYIMRTSIKFPKWLLYLILPDQYDVLIESFPIYLLYLGIKFSYKYEKSINLKNIIYLEINKTDDISKFKNLMYVYGKHNSGIYKLIAHNMYLQHIYHTFDAYGYDLKIEINAPHLSCIITKYNRRVKYTNCFSNNQLYIIFI